MPFFVASLTDSSPLFFCSKCSIMGQLTTLISELEIGELLHDELYTLDESVTVPELMDPKMDTGDNFTFTLKVKLAKRP
jgi:hypothetical protein